MRSLFSDVAYSVRSLLRAPSYTALALLTIALGVGATTSIFSVVNAVLLRPLPYIDGDRLVLVWADMRARDVIDFPFAAPDFSELRERDTALEEIAGVNTFPGALTGDDSQPEQIRVAAVTPNMFRVLGVEITHGRDFLPEDAAPPPPPPPALPGEVAGAPPPPLPTMGILSHEFWQRRYGGDVSMVGRTVQLGANSIEIIGVAQPGVELLLPPSAAIDRRPDLWVAQRINYSTAPRNNHFLRVVGRLSAGASMGALQSQLDAFGADLRAEHAIKEGAKLHFRAVPMRENLVADVRPALLALMGAVLFVLLIACANVANLQLVRSAMRERELAIRSAIGGSRSRLVRQMMTESAILAAAGAALGLVLAWWGVRLLLLLEPADLPRVDAVGIDSRVMAFAALTAAAATVLFGVVPALRASRTDLAGVLRRSGRTSGLAGSEVLRSGVVVAQVALCFVLLIGSGLMLRSLAALHAVDPGFDPAGVITFRAPPRQGGAAGATYVAEVRERLAALPGVRNVSAASPLPLQGLVQHGRWGLADAEQDVERFRQADMRFVLPGYFDAMGTRLLAGRDFTDADNVATSQVVIIDELLARLAFGDVRAAVGERILTRLLTPEPEWFEVIGVSAHQRNVSLAEQGREAIHFPGGKLGPGAADRWMVRATGDPNAVMELIRAEIASIDALVPVAEVRLMDEFVRGAMARTRFALTLIAIFAGVAAILAAVGVYGVLATIVRQRTPEIGVRVAFGAAPHTIRRHFLAQGLRLGLAGVLLGAGAALMLTRLVAGLLVGVEPTDPGTYTVMAVLFTGVIAAASWLPASRASRLQPNVALRE